MRTKKNRHGFDVRVAERTSVNHAIILDNIIYWVDKNRTSGINEHDGKFWTYNPISAFENQFPYLSKHQINKVLSDLEEEGVIYTGNYNKIAFDRTKWYSVNWDHDFVKINIGEYENRKSITKKSEMEDQKTGNGNIKNRKPIPDTIPNTTTNTIPDTDYVEQQSCTTRSDKNDFYFENQSPKDPEKKEKKGSAEKKEKYSDQISEVVEYLNDATGRNFDPASQHSKHIRARLKGGATIQEMKEVIDLKARAWIDSEKMREYLRPQTLFNKTKYADYRDEIKRVGKKAKALEELVEVVEDFVNSNGLIISWSGDEYAALQKIAERLKVLMKRKGEEMTMGNLKMIFNQVLFKLNDHQRKNFSMILINKNLNTILNADKRDSKAEWRALVAQYN